VGASADYAPLTSEIAYSDTLAHQFDYVTTGNTLKWGVVQAVDPETWDFGQADAIVAFAEAHHQAIKGHTLVWHQQLPPFVDGNLSADLLRRYLRANIHREVGRYRGRLYAWDVVNEAIAEDGSGLRDTVFSEKLGPDFVAWAFREAHRADPHAKLFYNDFNAETVNAKSNAIYALVRGLLAAGVPIDGVGFQMHFDAASAPSTEDMVTNLARFTALGLDVNISELDVTVASLSVNEAEKLAVQKQVYHRVTAACLQVPRCEAVTTWGFTDKYSWRAPDEALEFDTQYHKKPAYFGMIDGLAGVSPDAVGAAPNLIPNATFEAGLDGWSASGGDFSWDDADSSGHRHRHHDGTSGRDAGQAEGAHTGRASGRVTGRLAASDGPATDITKRVVPGRAYDVSAWARVAGAVNARVSLGARISCAGAPDVDLELGAATAARASWTALAGSLEVPACTLTSVSLYIAGPRPGIDLSIDDVALRPRPEPRGPNVVANPGFETGDTSGWVTWGPTIAVTAAAAHGGVNSAIVTGRTQTWMGPVLPLSSIVQPGATYAASAWVQIAGSSADAVRLTLKTSCAGVADSYQPLGSGTATSTGWVELAGTFVVPLCQLTELDVYVEGPAAGVDVLVDDVAVEQLLWHPVATSTTSIIISNPDFESGVAGWAAFGDGAISASTAFAHTGSASAEDSNRTAAWNGPSYTLANTAATYAVSAWALQDGTEQLPLLLSAKLACGDATNYLTVASATTAPDTWVQLQGQLAVPAGCSAVMLYLQQGSGVVFPNLYIDDVSAVPVPVPSTEVVTNGDFESGTAGWSAFGAGTLGTSATIAHGGAQSGVDSGRTAEWNGPSYALPTSAASYDVSAWVYQGGAQSVDLLLTTKLDCAGVTSYPTVAGPAPVAPGTWVQLTGHAVVPADCTAVLLYLDQSAGGEVFPDLYIDDVHVSL
jgi:GH35 family endo-1,4-beta-xylanase